MAARRFRWVMGIPLLALAAQGCFYDSRWGEAKRAQQHNAARATPSAIHASSEDERPAARHALRTFRVRFRATPAYAAQTLDWPRRVRDLVDDANEVLGPGYAARLEVTATEAWDAPEVESSLATALAALKKDDDAKDADWVVGLVGGLPRVTTSFHELGMAPLFSKHLVMRATGKLEEHDAIQKGFDELSDDARAKLLHDRRRHRAMAVFLHELAHTLGAVHETSARSLLYPEYRPEMEAFDEASDAWIRASLAHRTDGAVLDAPGAFAAEVLPAFRTSPSWATQERDDMVAMLEKASAPPPAAPVASEAPIETPAAPPPALPAPTPRTSAKAAPKAPPSPNALASLAPEDRARFEEVERTANGGDAAAAWTLGKPLFAKYPRIYEVQDLRCRVATKAFAWAAAREECDPMMKLAIDPNRRR